jgi:signal transduction histidine kinase
MNQMVWYALALLLIGYCRPARGAPPLRDSLQSLIEQHPDPCDQVYPMLRVALSYRGQDQSQMAAGGQAALAAAKACGEAEGRMKCHNLLGVCYLDEGSYRDALVHFLASYHLADSLHDQRSISRCLNNLGVIFWHQEEYDKALQTYLKAMTLIDPARDSVLMGRYCYNIGMIYQDHHQLPDSAEAYYQRAIEIARRQADTVGMVDAHNSLGLLTLKQGQPRQAEGHFRQAIDLATPSEQADQLYYPTYNLAHLLHTRGDDQGALLLTQQTLALAHHMNGYDMLQSSYALLASIDSAQGRMSAALKHFQLSARYADSLRNETHSQAMAELQANFDLAESKKENEALRLREKEQEAIIRSQHNGLLIGTILMGTMIGLVVGLIVLTRQRREALHRLREASEDKDALLSIVAHDLKAPLSNIREISKLLAEQGTTGSDAHQFALLVWQEARRGEHLVRNLLDFDALSKGQAAPQTESFDLIALLKRLHITYCSLAAAKHLTLHWHSRLAAAPLHTDPVYLTRILDNLLTNAIKFSPVDRAIWLAVDMVQGEIWIRVRDEGPGIAAEDQERLFEKYQRLGHHPTGGESTSGIGLSIVKSLSESLGATVSVESQVGEGATFSVHLPFYLYDGPLVPASQARA